MNDKLLPMKNINDLDKEEIIELENYLQEYKKSFNIYLRILAVRMVKLGETRTFVGEFIHKDRKTIGRWVNNYDENGIDGLIPDYSNCGAKCKLTNEQLLNLKEKLKNPDESYTIEDARKLIKDDYNVEYTYKQAWEIVRKKLGFSYCKPFIVYNEAPENAEEIFKKKLAK